GALKVTDHSNFDLQVRENKLLVFAGDGVSVVVGLEQKAVLSHSKIRDINVSGLSVERRRKHRSLVTSDRPGLVFDLETWKPICRLEGHTNSVFALSYFPNGKVLVSGGRDAHLKFWETEQYREIESIVAHMFAINYVSFRQDGRYFVSCSMDKSIKLWDGHSFKLLKV